MDEVEKNSQTKPEDKREEVDSSGARRDYVAPNVTVIELTAVIKGASGKKNDMGVPAKP